MGEDVNLSSHHLHIHFQHDDGNLYQTLTESMANMNEPKKRPVRYKHIMVHLTPEQISILTQWAEEKTISRSGVIRELVNKEIQHKQKGL